MNCKCNKYSAPLTTVEEIRRRSSVSAEIEETLEEIESDSSKWRSVLRCKDCGAIWAREYLPERYNPPCLYQITTDNPRAWLEQSETSIPKIYRRYEDKAFWDSLGEEVGPERCRHEGCNRKRIDLSVLCKLHHFESIMKRSPDLN